MDTDLIFDLPASGPWNMGFDEALGERAAQTGRPAVRFYQWDPATLSLGYFQPYASRGEHPGSADLPAVRRASGGGAIIHDRELTYSCALPVRDRLGRPAQQLVDEFHQALRDALREWSIAARLCGSALESGREREPFLCFLRRAQEDVLLDGAKIAGSAQRRQRGSVLQHGSVLLARSPAAPELPGILELAGRQVDPQELARAWAARLQTRLGLRFSSYAFDEPLRTRADGWQRERFASSRWTRKR